MLHCHSRCRLDEASGAIRVMIENTYTFSPRVNAFRKLNNYNIVVYIYAGILQSVNCYCLSIVYWGDDYISGWKTDDIVRFVVFNFITEFINYIASSVSYHHFSYRRDGVYEIKQKSCLSNISEHTEIWFRAERSFFSTDFSYFCTLFCWQSDQTITNKSIVFRVLVYLYCGFDCGNLI